MVWVACKVILELGFESTFISINGFFFIHVGNLLFQDAEGIVVLGDSCSLSELMEMLASLTDLVGVTKPFFDSISEFLPSCFSGYSEG